MKNTTLLLKMSIVSPDTSRETVTPLTENTSVCEPNKMLWQLDYCPRRQKISHVLDMF